MFSIRRSVVAVCVLGLALSACTSGGGASDSDQGAAKTSGGSTIGLGDKVTASTMSDVTAQALKGKSVVFIPLALGLPVYDTLDAELRLQFGQAGVKYTVKNPGGDPQKEVAALQAAINEKPDAIIVNPLDPQLLSKQIQEARSQGIYVVQLETQSSAVSDAYVGSDWLLEGDTLGGMVAEKCAGKDIGVIHALPNASYEIQFFQNFNKVAKAKGMKLVAEQTAGLDPTKAASIARAMLEQHPDLCGLVGTYDEMMIGAGNAVKSVGSQGKVGVWTTSAGNAGCEGAKSGAFTASTASSGPRLSIAIPAVTKMLLQSNIAAGTSHFAVYTPILKIDKSNYADPNLCFGVSK